MLDLTTIHSDFQPLPELVRDPLVGGLEFRLATENYHFTYKYPPVSKEPDVFVDRRFGPTVRFKGEPWAHCELWVQTIMGRVFRIDWVQGKGWGKFIPLDPNDQWVVD